MGEYERAKAAFDYLIQYTVMDDPIGLDLWRIYGGGEEPISFVEQRALSVLRFGVGSCEDYAAALTILLREMGLEAEYVPGLTYSLEGNLVDHAWTKAKIDGVWYHLTASWRTTSPTGERFATVISCGETPRWPAPTAGDKILSAPVC